MNSINCTLLTKTLRTALSPDYEVDGPFISSGEALIEVRAYGERAVGIILTRIDPLANIGLMEAVALIEDKVKGYLDAYANPFFATRDKKGKACDFIYRTKDRTVAMFDRCTGNSISFHSEDLNDKSYDNLPRFTHITKDNIDGLQSMLYFDGQQVTEKKHDKES